MSDRSDNANDNDNDNDIVIACSLKTLSLTPLRQVLQKGLSQLGLNSTYILLILLGSQIKLRTFSNFHGPPALLLYALNFQLARVRGQNVCT